MNYTALARKWRPRSFAEMTGQEHVLRALANALDSGRLHHAYLFTGTRGVGKTTVARALAKCFNCERGVSASPCGECASCREIDAGRSVDVLELDAASHTKVEETRELLDNVPYAPARSRYKIYLIDEVHMLSAHSFNALLKTLEEPPPHVRFLLATTDPQKLPVTVLSRCLQFNLKRLPVRLIAARLQYILEQEKLEFELAALTLLAQAGDGSLRDALSLLDQLLAYGNGRATEAEARAMLGTVDRAHAEKLAELLAAGDANALFDYAATLEQWSVDYAQLLQQLAGLFEAAALMQAVKGYQGEEAAPVELLQRLAAGMSAADVQFCYQAALVGRRDLALAPDPRSGFRMSLLRMLAFRLDDARAANPPASGGDLARPVAVPQAASNAASATGSTAGSMAVPVRPISGAEFDWQQLLAAGELSGAARQLAANCEYLGRDGAVLRLAVDARSAVVRTRAQEDKLTQVLSKHLGAAVTLQFVERGAAVDSPARQAERAAQQLLGQARQEFAADATVRALQQEFGASIHPDSVRAAGGGDLKPQGSGDAR